MTQEESQYILYRIHDEGFDYTFDGYSGWKDIKDEKFHNLRQLYLSAKENLKLYLEEQYGPTN